MTLPKNLQTVITKNAGHIVPVELLALIIAKKPTVFGYAVQDGEGLSIGREEGTPLMADLESMNGDTKDFRSQICFGWLEQGFNSEDILPFALYDEDKPFLSIAIEGDFPKYDTNNGRTQEFNLLTEIISPALQDICELTDGDIAKLLAALGKPSFNNNFLGHVGHRGILSILPYEGDFVSLSKNELGEVYDWGTVSQRHGYGDAKQEPAPVEAKMPRFSFGSKKEEAPAVVGPTKTSVPEVKVTVKPADTATKLSGTPVKPPEWLHSNEDKKAWYMMVAGGLPKEWKRRIPVIPVEGIAVPAKIEDLQAWRAAKLKAGMVQNPQKTETSAGPVKTEAEVKAIKQEEGLPIIPAKEMESLFDFVAKHLDGQSVEMTNPSQIQAMEKKFPALSEALGLKPHDLLNWPVSGLFALAKHDYRAIVLGFLEMRNLWRGTLKLEDLAGTTKPVVTTTTAKLGDNTTKQESISSETPKKKWSFGKKAA